jgi:hypothetical protein
MLVTDGRGGVSTMGRSWAFLVGSEVPAFRTIARGEIEDTPGCVIGEPTSDKITAALAVAPTAHATDGTKRG